MNYSPLNQITAANVAGLKPVWVWDSGKFGRTWETRPLLIDGLLYLTESQTGDTIALEPETGKLVWRAKPPVTVGAGLNRRSFAYWAGDGAMKPRLVAIWGHKIYGYDLKTGQLSSDWPATGLEIGLPNPAEGGKIGGGVQSNSPPIIYKNMIITMGATGFLPPPAQPADPHANDLRTGKLLWTARIIPGKGEPGGDSWGPETQSVVSMGGWGHMTLDEASGTVYVPTDSPSPDYVGIWRPGDNVGSGLHRRDRRGDRQDQVALPGTASRHLRSGHQCRARAGDDHQGRQAHEGGGAAHQAGDDLDPGCRRRASRSIPGKSGPWRKARFRAKNHRPPSLSPFRRRR